MTRHCSGCDDDDCPRDNEDPSDVIQIMPSAGWVAWFYDDDLSPYRDRVVGWGLCRNGAIRPLVVSDNQLLTVGDDFDEISNFMYVVPESEPTPSEKTVREHKKRADDRHAARVEEYARKPF